MKDWKVWVLCIAIFLLVKMCGGCNGCGGTSESDETPIKTRWTCDICGKTFEYYKDKIGDHDKWYDWSGRKYCSNCYGFRKSVNDALKKNDSPYADYNH